MPVPFPAGAAPTTTSSVHRTGPSCYCCLCARVSLLVLPWARGRSRFRNFAEPRHGAMAACVWDAAFDPPSCYQWKRWTQTVCFLLGIQGLVSSAIIPEMPKVRLCGSSIKAEYKLGIDSMIRTNHIPQKPPFCLSVSCHLVHGLLSRRNVEVGMVCGKTFGWSLICSGVKQFIQELAKLE